MFYELNIKRIKVSGVFIHRTSIQNLKAAILSCGKSVLGGAFGGGSDSGFWLVSVKLHKLGKIELWLLEDLNLSDHAVVLKWVDLGAFRLDLFANFFFNAILNKTYN